MNELFVDNSSIEKIVHDYSDMIIRIAYQNLKSIKDAEDIAQETFIKMIHNIEKFKSTEHLKAWLIRVTINKCNDFRKSAWFKRTVLINDELNYLSDNDYALLEDVFRLPVKYRNVIYLYYYEGYTIAEIAGILNRSINTVNSQLQRARKMLKNILLEEGVFS